MKKIILVIITSIVYNLSFSQSPKGDRILSWQVDMTENVNYDSAFAYAQRGCIESVHLSIPWSGIETNNSNFDKNFINNTLDIADFYYPISGTQVELQLATINTTAKETPSDLLTTNFDDPLMISRFKTLLDTLFVHIPNLELAALNIGNEVDIYMNTDIVQYNAYKTFLDSVVPYAKQHYFAIHGTELKIGTTCTHDGLTSPSKSSLCQILNDSLDIVSLTYYPLNSDFTMQAPTVVSNQFEELVTIYSDTLQPIYFAECGYASSSTCNSSEALQAEFYENVFSAWDTYSDHIKYLTLFKTTDWAQLEVDSLGRYYGITDSIFLEYLRTLGVRTWQGDGMNKLAYNTILCELNARGWCAIDIACRQEPEPNAISRVQEEEILIYPNPIRNVVEIKTEQKIEYVNLYDFTGKLSLSSKDNRIDISKLANGVYYANVQLKNGSIISKKIIKE